MDREASVLTEIMKDSLVENRVFLVTNLSNIPEIMDYLMEKKVFPDTEDVLCTEKRKEQVRKLLDRLQKRPAADYWKFISCLFQDRIGQGNIADKILSVYLNKGGTLPPEISRLHQDYLDSQRQDNLPQGQQHHQISPQQPAAAGHASSMEPDGDFRLPPPQPGLQAASCVPHRSDQGHVVSIDSESLARQRAAQQEVMETDSGDRGQLSASLQGAGAGAAAGPGDESKYYRKKREKRDGVYKMESNPRGLALIIDNENFESLLPRTGTREDRESLNRMLTDVLGFEVIVKADLTLQAMRQALTEFSQLPLLQEVDSCIVAVMSHGAKGGVIFGTDGRVDSSGPVRDTYIFTTEIREYFGAISCPCMSGKPKLFIIQACRGTTEDTTRGLIPLGRDIAIENSSDCRTGAAYLDMAWINATVEEMVAYRQTLIPAVTEVFMEYAATKSVQSMMTQIHDKMKKMQLEEGRFVAPGTEPNLSKSWYLNPPSSSC